MKQKYFLYARKSSESEERQVMSIEAQLAELSGEYARRENIYIAETFIESKSAKQPGRTEFNKMIQKIYASKEPIGIVAWHPDRLARNSLDGGQIIYLIDIQKICGLKFPTFWFEPTPQGKFMLQVAFGQSKYYSDNLSENVKRGVRQKLRRGEWIGKAPVGYLNNPKTHSIDLDPVKSKIIKKVFKEFSQGKHSLDSARERLRFFGIEGKLSKPYALSSMQRMLTNWLYTGIIKHKGEFYEGKHEPIVDIATFEAVQEQFKLHSRPRKSKHKHDFPLTGIFTCGECGCGITAQFAKGRHGGIYRYYRCSKKKCKCSQGYLREDLLQNQLRDVLQTVALPEGWAHELLAQVEVWEKEQQKNLISFAQNVETKSKDTEEKLDKLVNAFLEETIDKDTYLRKKEELIKLKTELSQRKADFGQKGKFWVEPLKNWIESAGSVEKFVSSKDFCFEKSLLGVLTDARTHFEQGSAI